MKPVNLNRVVRKSKAVVGRKRQLRPELIPLLDNLCVAYLAIEDMQQANQYWQRWQ